MLTNKKFAFGGKRLGGFALAALMAGSLAHAPEAIAGSLKQQGKLDVEIYGIITRALLYADDGDQSQLFQVDGGAENTRIGFAASGQLTESWQVGGMLEHDVGISNGAGDAALGANGEVNADTTNFGIRVADVAFQHKSMGTFTIGQGDAASVDRVASDLSGSDLALTAAAGDLAGGMNFYNTATGARAVTIGDVFDKIDGFDKVDRVRYDAPEINGVALAVSYIDTGTWDIGATWAAQFGDTEVEVSGFYANASAGSTTDEGMYGGSIAAKHGSGVSLTFAGAKREQKADNRDAPQYYWGKLGYSAALTSLGETHFGVSYGVFENFAQNDDEAKELGLGIVQDLESIGSNLWFTARNHELDRPGSTLDDIFIISTGVVLNF